jgi:predicted DNA-binding transcriptional regulator YafY
MSRPERLLALLQALRRHRHPVSGQALAEQMGVSIRTLYRDIASLQAQGAAIEGEPGVGYVMKPGFMLPPLMFQPEEIEALVLGMRWVADRGDRSLSDGARNAMAKISAVLPPPVRRELEDSALLVGTSVGQRPHAVEPDVLREAIRAEHKLRLSYQDPAGALSQRVVWPFALVYFEQSRVLSAWCEMRGDFRNFRTDRITDVEGLGVRYPKRRQALLKAWRAAVQASGRSILPEVDSVPT